MRTHWLGRATEEYPLIAHFVDSKIFGGCEEMVLQILAGIDLAKRRTLLLHHDEPGLVRLVESARRLGLHSHSLPRTEPTLHRPGCLALARALHELRVSVFHVHLNWPLGCRQALIAARCARVPAIVATAHLFAPIHGTRLAGVKQWIQSRCVDRYVAVSSEVRDRLVSDLGVSADKVRVVHNGIGTTRGRTADDRDLRAAMAIEVDRPMVLTPARLHLQKGHEFLLRAVVSVPDAVFVLAGDGPERGLLEALARDLGVADRVRFLGQRDDVAALLGTCDLMVLPSMFEGLPVSVLEAMAAEKPVIATAIGGTDEAVVHGESGLLVSPRDPAALADAIRTLLGDRGYAARLAAAGRARVEAQFSREAMVAGLCRVYDEVLG